MNDFVNPKKRSIQLPKGAKDLADVLQASHRSSLDNVKCEYCGAPAVCVSGCCAIPGVMKEEIHGWCERCLQDLSEFSARPENKLPDDLDIDDDAAMEQMSEQLAERKRREREFMRQRVRERKSQ
jgi:hypothetical protein